MSGADLVREVTDDFCSAFAGPNETFGGGFARVIAAGLIPECVDPRDPRVVEIVRRCKEAATKGNP